MNRRNAIKTFLGAFSLSSLNQLTAFASGTPKTEKMPALFLGHGSPMNAIEENRFVKGFREIGKTIPQPTAILCISAHWYTRGTKITAMKTPKTIHDFGGFPRALHEFQYPAKGSPELAKATQKIVQPTNAKLDLDWGLDHGAWSVITHLYPKANVPVIQMSVDASLNPKQHFELGRKLDVLRERGILIIGSGNIVHNLRQVDVRNINKPNHGYDWAFEASKFVNDQVVKGDYRPLLDYAKHGRAMELAIPTPDHYLPLLYVLALNHEPEKMSRFNDELIGGSISMTSFKVVG